MDEKVSNLFTAWSGFKEKIKSRIPESCSEIAERVHINTRRDEHEMGTFKSYDRQDGIPAATTYGEYQEGDQSNGYYNTGEGAPAPIDPHTGTSGKISAWQAGWNVTNAIQVLSTSSSTYHSTLLYHCRECSLSVCLLRSCTEAIGVYSPWSSLPTSAVTLAKF